MWLIKLVFPQSANRICRSTDISKYFRQSLGIWDNESWQYVICGACKVHMHLLHFQCFTFQFVCPKFFQLVGCILFFAFCSSVCLFIGLFVTQYSWEYSVLQRCISGLKLLFQYIWNNIVWENLCLCKWVNNPFIFNFNLVCVQWSGIHANL